MLLEAAITLYGEMLRTWVPSTWSIKTSMSVEADLLIFAESSGVFYLTDSSDPNGPVHPVAFCGVGITKSKGPIVTPFGGSYSTTDMPGGGVDKIYMKPGKGSLSLSDFYGSGCIVSGAVTIPGQVAALMGFGGTTGPMETWGASLLFFGAPPLFTEGIGLYVGRQEMLPGVGITWLPCVFLKSDQPRAPRQATLPQSQFGSGDTTPSGGVSIPRHNPNG